MKVKKWRKFLEQLENSLKFTSGKSALKTPRSSSLHISSPMSSDFRQIIFNKFVPLATYQTTSKDVKSFKIREEYQSDFRGQVMHLLHAFNDHLELIYYHPFPWIMIYWSSVSWWRRHLARRVKLQWISTVFPFINIFIDTFIGEQVAYSKTNNSVMNLKIFLNLFHWRILYKPLLEKLSVFQNPLERFRPDVIQQVCSNCCILNDK